MEVIRFEVDDGVALITLNRPDRLNTLSVEISQEFIRLLDIADEDPNIRVVVLTGEGRAFCGGADLALGVSTFAPVASTSSEIQRDWGGVLALRIFEMLKPTIAAINGAAVGIGATLTLPCDVRMASTGARFGFVFTRRGIVPDGCATWFLPRVVGISNALRWCLSGELVGSKEAYECGLVSSLHDPATLLDDALKYATEMSRTTSAVSVSLTRKLLWRGLTDDHPMISHRLESSLIAATSSMADAEEGVESFLEKRPANFRGRVPDDLPSVWPLWSEHQF